jgi:hypothetical protein
MRLKCLSVSVIRLSVKGPFLKNTLVAAAAALILTSCGGGGGGDAPATPIDQYLGQWQRCDTVGSIFLSFKVQTVWTITKSGPTSGQLVVHETLNNACDQPGGPPGLGERRQIATGQISLTGTQQQAQGETWDRAIIQVQKVGDDCSPSPSVCSAYLGLIQRSSDTLRTSQPPVLSTTRLAPAQPFTRGAEGYPATFEVTTLTRQ